MFPSFNYTQIPNVIFDEMLPLMKEAELRIFMFICRQTLGWHRREHKISFSFMAKGTGMERKSVRRAVKEALARKTITRRLAEDGKSYFYSININFEKDLPDPLDDDLDDEELGGVQSTQNDGVPSTHPNENHEYKVGSERPQEGGVQMTPKERKNTYKESPPPLRVASANATATLRVVPPGEEKERKAAQAPSNAVGNADEELKKNFEKSLRDKEKVERAIKYFNENREVISSKSNPIGFVIYMIKNDEDLKADINEEIILSRKLWASQNEYAVQGGSRTACSSGIETCSGSYCTFLSYDSSDPFWERIGLGFKL